VIPIRSLQMRLSLDALAAQISFQIVFWVTLLNMIHNDNIKTSDGNTTPLATNLLLVSPFIE